MRELGPWKGGSIASCQHLCPQASGAEEELLPGVDVLLEVFRSEERRVGKECRSRWSPYH